MIVSLSTLLLIVCMCSSSNTVHSTEPIDTNTDKDTNKNTNPNTITYASSPRKRLLRSSQSPRLLPKVLPSLHSVIDPSSSTKSEVEADQSNTNNDYYSNHLKRNFDEDATESEKGNRGSENENEKRDKGKRIKKSDTNTKKNLNDRPTDGIQEEASQPQPYTNPYLFGINTNYPLSSLSTQIPTTQPYTKQSHIQAGDQYLSQLIYNQIEIGQPNFMSQQTFHGHFCVVGQKPMNVHTFFIWALLRTLLFIFTFPKILIHLDISGIILPSCN